jgi:zinc-ribbon domain
MPLQHLFTKREQRIIANATKEDLVQRSAAYWGQKGYRINFYGPYQVHGEHVESRLGLRQVIDLNITDFNQNVAVDLSLSATLGDTEAVVGAVGLLLIPLAAVVVGGISYIDYDQSATASIAGYWSSIFNMEGAVQPQQVVPLKCRSCGTALEPDSKFCKNCGERV